MWVIRAVLIALLIIIVVAFAYYNLNLKQEVVVDLLFWGEYEQVPLLTVVFWSFISGIFVSLLLFISMYIKLSLQLRNSNKKITALEGEVTILRNRPIEESAEVIRDSDESESNIKSPFESDE